MRFLIPKESINRFFDNGTRTYCKIDVGEYGGYNWPRINQCLQEWQQRGLLKIVKPLEEAKDNEVVIEMLDYIDQKSPWPNWPLKKS